ncbi:hypothetical protein QJS83_10455 [Bdellovibrio sp. 22V]|uniref:hypothetical protein n=1 Tax=Bdellovibrio TaxID=958 RepID=UPI002542EB2F|nr:hypothetical protein [Bdellovibrio sp. 22V]WII70881.1 hypothetical protein QJS83_10455 [Bdellovibrio sp. 22V]
MRFLLFVLSLVSTCMASAATPVSGTVVKDPSGVYLLADNGCYRYLVDTKSEDAAESLRKLASGDTITASGLLDKDTCTAVIESIDYVGLKKMLGYWYSQEGVITVRDFKSLNFYPINMKDFQNGSAISVVEPVRYTYSITPSGGKEWVLFLSDSTSTTFATIQFNKSNATMKIYDSETGNINKILRLSKWGNLK